MAKWIHYVVAVNLETGEAILDDDTFTAKFYHGGVYDDDTQEWREETDEESEFGYIALRKPIMSEEN